MDYKEIIEKLIGAIDPIGESTADGRRFENLKNMTDLVEGLLYEIGSVARHNKDRHEDSMKKAGKFANEFLGHIVAEHGNQEKDDLLCIIKEIRKSDCGGWLKDCTSGLHQCAAGKPKRQELMKLLDLLYKAAEIK